MAKTAFLFSGQGAQYVGMGLEAANQFDSAAFIFKKANEALGFSIEDICFEENDLINQTEYTQPAILTTSIALLEVLKEKGITADVYAGLSLGEYSALVAADIIKFEDAVKLVNKRGKYMTEAVKNGEGTMAAIIGMSSTDVEELCIEASKLGVCEPANYNCPGQIVIGGEVLAVRKGIELALEKGAKKAIELNVSGPFHTSMLESAAKKLSGELENIEINNNDSLVVANTTADYVDNKEDFRTILQDQVMNPVKWDQSIRLMIKDGVDTFIEVGPGKALSGFVKMVMRDLGVKVKVYNVEDIKSLERTLSKLGEQYELTR